MEQRILKEETKQREVYDPNGDGTYSKRIVEEDASLRYYENEAELGFRVGNEPIAASQKDFIAPLAKIFALIDAENKEQMTIAHIGGGVAWLARMLTGYGYDQHIYEISPEIIAWNRDKRLNDQLLWVEGDWRQTLSGEYDAIIYDITEPLSEADEAQLRSHLKAQQIERTKTGPRVVNEAGKLYRTADYV